jgi:hypothetical protein
MDILFVEETQESWKSHRFLFCKIKAFKNHGKLHFIE